MTDSIYISCPRKGQPRKNIEACQAHCKRKCPAYHETIKQIEENTQEEEEV